MSRKGQILFVPHGGGPLPLFGDPGHKNMIDFVKNIPKKLNKPSAIVVISAHWEEKTPTITGGENPEMIYDYHGFPPESYEIKYPASGNPKLANKVKGLFSEYGISAKIDSKRGYDHGLYVPLMLMYPDADIPSIQISQLNNLDAKQHIELGKAIGKLMDENILVVGSGFTFHNMREFFSSNENSDQLAMDFNSWIIETITDKNLSEAEREQRLIDWKDAPGGRFSHPREEHLLTLHVCYGIAAANGYKAELVFDDKVVGKRASGFLWKDN